VYYHLSGIEVLVPSPAPYFAAHRDLKKCPLFIRSGKHAFLRAFVSPPVENQSFAQSRIERDRNELASGGPGGYGDYIGYVFIRNGFARLVSLSLCSGPNEHYVLPVMWVPPAKFRQDPTVRRTEIPNGQRFPDSSQGATKVHRTVLKLLEITQSLIHATKPLQHLAEANYRLLRIDRYTS